MPTEAHQLTVQALFLAFHAHITPANLGTLVFAPIRIRTVRERFREPDLAFLGRENDRRRGNAFWDGADLVVEVVSDDDASRQRDRTTKRAEYAEAGIREYWIVDPAAEQIVVLTLVGDRYHESGSYGPGDQAESTLLPGLTVDVTNALKPTS